MNERSSSPSMGYAWLPGGVLSTFSSLPDRMIVRGQGGRCWDQNDQDYIDFICGYGPISLGHNCTEVNRAAIDQLEKGMIFPAHSPVQNQLSSKLQQLFPYTGGSLFLKTGSEAVAAAVRLARAYTRKTKIIRCGFLGWHDSFVSPYSSWHLYEADPKPARLIRGVPVETSAPVLHWDGEDIQELAGLVRINKTETAAIILDPIQLREPLRENLEMIRQISQENGLLLILDEIKTGFRVSLQGVQGLYNLQPDLTVFSKAIANGFPLAIVTGTKEIMDLSPEVRIMGTYNNELMSLAAAVKTISILEQPGSIPWLWQVGAELIQGINTILKRYDLLEHIQAVPYRWPCLPALWFRQSSTLAQALQPKLQPILAAQGVLLLLNHPNFTCLAHTHADIEDALERIDTTFKLCMPQN